ncbi:MAG: DUF1565 domain-containing protein [Niabella sp.]
MLKGSDNNPGSHEMPFRTIAKAVSVVRAGDEIKIVKVNFPIHEEIVIHNKSGEPDKPIIIDGQDNVFTGADSLKTADWKEIRPGVYENDDLIPDLKTIVVPSASSIQRYFMMWNGVQNRMGRSSKGTVQPLIDPDKIRVGEWTYEDSKTAFYIATDPEKKLSDYYIETPIRQNGVGFGGTCKHWIIRNIHVTHFINDGFNIHGNCEDLVFENITATECGDDGISAHENCKIAIKGFIARRNSTGICHGDPYVTCKAENILLEDNYGYNLLLRNGIDTFINSTISAVVPQKGFRGVSLLNAMMPGSLKPLSVTFMNCKFPFANSGNSKSTFTVEKGVALNISPYADIKSDIKWLPAREQK